MTFKNIAGYLGITMIVTACAAPQPVTSSNQPSQDIIRQKTKEFLLCAIRSEPAVDDKISDARTIALGLTNRCGMEYQAVTEVGIVTQDRVLRRMWVQSRNSEQGKIESSLDIVLSMRRGATPNPSPVGPLLLPPSSNR